MIPPLYRDGKMRVSIKSSPKDITQIILNIISIPLKLEYGKVCGLRKSLYSLKQSHHVLVAAMEDSSWLMWNFFRFCSAEIRVRNLGILFNFHQCFVHKFFSFMNGRDSLVIFILSHLIKKTKPKIAIFVLFNKNLITCTKWDIKFII